MTNPRIEILPFKAAARRDEATTLDVLVRITPPLPEVHFQRPTINLGLVLDRSGSMGGGRKMAHAREAAAFAVRSLLPSDQVAVVIFDSEVEAIVPCGPVADQEAIARLIDAVQPRGSTALHAGWKEGADQVERHHVHDGLNRVVLLSDGQANQGVTDPNAIATECKGRAARGVATTTMGLGDDYNEDLMQAMAEAGDGNYYFIETPVQLADIFQTELKGLMANVGSKVSLGVEPQGGASVSEVLNDMERNARGRLMLPGLTVGMPIQVVIRLNVPPMAREAEVCRFRLAWDDPKANERRTLHAELALGSAESSAWDAMPGDPAVAEQVALKMAARAKREAVARYDQGDYAGTIGYMGAAAGFVACLAESPGAVKEMREIAEARADLEGGKGAVFRKKALLQAYQKKRGTE